MSGSYWQRTSCPSSGDSNFTMADAGGVSPCIPGDPQLWTGSTLANCVGYVWGRWSEMGCAAEATARGMANSASYIRREKSGYRSDSPNRGACVVFTYQHVAIVESYDDNYIYCTQSSYQRGATWETTTYSRSNSTIWGYLQFPGDSPTPGPTPTPEPDQPISPIYGPGGTIWLSYIYFSFHYTSTDTSDETFHHPAMQLYVNGNKIGGGGHASAGSDQDWKYSDINVGFSPPIKTDNIQIRLDGACHNCNHYAINGSAAYVKYYTYSSTDIGGTSHIRYFDGEKWTDWSPSLY